MRRQGLFALLVVLPALAAAKAKVKRRQQPKPFSATFTPHRRSQVPGCLALGMLFELPGVSAHASAPDRSSSARARHSPRSGGAPVVSAVIDVGVPNPGSRGSSKAKDRATSQVRPGDIVQKLNGISMAACGAARKNGGTRKGKTGSKSRGAPRALGWKRQRAAEADAAT